MSCFSFVVNKSGTDTTITAITPIHTPIPLPIPTDTHPYTPPPPHTHTYPPPSQGPAPSANLQAQADEHSAQAQAQAQVQVQERARVLRSMAQVSDGEFRGIDAYFQQLVEIQDIPAVSKESGGDIIYLCIALNRLKNLNGIDMFPELIVCDASMNMLTEVNQVRWNERLQHLVLNTNSIHALPVLSTLSHLRFLDISNNCLTSLSAVANHPCLEVLNVSRNPDLATIDHVGSVMTLRSFSFQDCNQLSLEGLRNLPHLVLLDGLRNKIANLQSTCKVLKSLPNLKAVVLKANPISAEREYLAAIVDSNLGVDRIDWTPVTEGMKLQVKKVRKADKTFELVRQVTDQFTQEINAHKNLFEALKAKHRAREKVFRAELETFSQRKQAEMDSCLAQILDKQQPKQPRRIRRMTSKVTPLNSSQDEGADSGSDEEPSVMVKRPPPTTIHQPVVSPLFSKGGAEVHPYRDDPVHRSEQKESWSELFDALDLHQGTAQPSSSKAPAPNTQTQTKRAIAWTKRTASEGSDGDGDGYDAAAAAAGATSANPNPNPALTSTMRRWMFWKRTDATIHM